MTTGQDVYDRYQDWHGSPLVDDDGPDLDPLDLLHSGPTVVEPATPGALDPMDVEREARNIRVREAAREKVAAEKAAKVAQEPFDAGLLADVLRRPPTPPSRIDSVMHCEASTTIVAPRKTGKTTLLGNVAHSLITR